MADSFDVQTFNEPVYKRIMGLADDVTVSDWYSLLGVAKFEQDEAKIDDAMLRRFERVRRYQVGNYEDQALRLIDELGRAYACLSDDESRRRYDQTLSGQSGSHTAVRGTEITESARPVPAIPVDAPTPSASRRVPERKSPERKSAPRATPDGMTCPQCGKPSSPKASVCYHCGHKKQESLLERRTKQRPDDAVTGMSLRELARQDLSPRQLLVRMQQIKALCRARQLAGGMWVAPRTGGRKGATEAVSRCGRCGRGLMHSADAYGMRDSDVRDTLESIQLYARKLESLGRDQFTWPLSDDDARRVRRRMSGSRGSGVTLYCQACATKFIQSSRIEF